MFHEDANIFATSQPPVFVIGLDLNHSVGYLSLETAVGEVWF